MKKIDPAAIERAITASRNAHTTIHQALTDLTDPSGTVSPEMAKAKLAQAANMLISAIAVI